MAVGKKVYFISVFILFLVGIIGFFLYRIYQVEKALSIPFIPKDSHITLVPPSSALIGKIVQMNGEVKRQARDKEEFEKITDSSDILQGESVRTLRNSRVTIEFTDFASIILSQNSQLDLINLIPDNFLFQQSIGNINFKVSPGKTFSNRILHSLISISDGETIISNDEDSVTIQVKSGRAKVAFVDLDNQTQVFELATGDKALIDDTQRRLVFD